MLAMNRCLQNARWFPVLAALSGTASCIPSIRSTFAELSYPADPPVSVPRDLNVAVDSALLSTLIVAYERPREAGGCLADLAADAATLTAMYGYGDCMAKGGTRIACSERLPWFEPNGQSPRDPGPNPPFSLRLRCTSPPSTEADRLALALSLDDAAIAIVSYQMAALGPSVLGAPPSKDLLAAFRQALAHAARLLSADPVTVHDPNQPALSLSGGAANGAFAAGYMYALLWTREVARAHASPAQCALLDRERFNSAAGSSVGSLISLPLDLYFTDAKPPPALASAIEACVREGSGKVAPRSDRPLQDCALAKLEHDFVANEWDLLCARSGTALDLLKPNSKSLLKFDPLDNQTLAPFFRTFGALTRDNAFRRTLIAADLGQGVVGAIDERACRLPGMNAEACEREAVLASVSEPILTPSRDRIFTGLSGPGGERGIWFDGGLQSVNPAARAVGATRGKVLALNTFRAVSTPVASVEGLAPVILGTLTSLGIRMIGWETSYAGLEQHRREAHACEVGRLVGITALCGGGAPGAAAPTIEPRLLSVSVPDDITPSHLFASGYTFDPVVMRGLFLWGERAFLRSRSQVLDFLDWCVPAALERGAACPGGEGQNPAFAAAVRDHERKVMAELETYKQYEAPGVWKKHLQDRKALVKREMKICAGD
jgi:hypothetical protein